jgi:hypothetical protein
MFERLRACCALTGLLALVAGWSTPAAAAEPDATLFTTYTVATDLKTANWVTCGSTQATEGCYSSGTIGPFGRIGAMLQDTAYYDGDIVTRVIYVLDVAAGTAGNDVTLFVYTRKDVISSTYDTTTVTLSRQISLPLVGGSTVTASMAENTPYLYVGTNQSLQAAAVKKSTWAVSSVGGFIPSIPVSSITSDNRGYVTVTFSSASGAESGFYVFGPTGGGEEDGGGSNFLLNATNAVVIPHP